MKIYFTPQCLQYGRQDHPESPDRVAAIHALLQKKGYGFTAPVPCSEQDILRVHSKTHMDSVKTGDFFDWDTPALPLIYEHALMAAGAAILASESADSGETAFSLMRPPGHHATRGKIMGFCYFNNMAIALSKYLENHPGNRVAVLDIDCHHGNGTEEIFLGNPSVFYVSLHQTHLFPGTGLSSRDNALNYPLPPMTGDKDYLLTLGKACHQIKSFKPDLVGVSAGFDTFKEDPLTMFNLNIPAYKTIGSMIHKLQVPTFILLEGGYAQHLPECVLSFLEGIEE